MLDTFRCFPTTLRIKVKLIITSYKASHGRAPAGLTRPIFNACSPATGTKLGQFHLLESFSYCSSVWNAILLLLSLTHLSDLRLHVLKPSLSHQAKQSWHHHFFLHCTYYGCGFYLWKLNCINVSLNSCYWCEMVSGTCENILQTVKSPRIKISNYFEFMFINEVKLWRMISMFMSEGWLRECLP